MDVSNMPHFTIRSVSRGKPGITFMGFFSKTDGVRNGFADLLVPPDKFVSGKIKRLKKRSGRAIFVTDDPKAEALLQPKQQVVYFDGYWGERAEIALNPDRKWKRTKFEPEDAMVYRHRGLVWVGKAVKSTQAEQLAEAGPPEIIENAWEHEHCAICWEKIAEYAQTHGYRDQLGTWICERCYEEYVQARSLAFIVEN